MAFRKKAPLILANKPDILIVPECEHPSKLQPTLEFPKPNDTLWFGDNQNKGLGIFSFSNYRFQVLPSHNPELQKIIPISVTGGEHDFTLFAIWAHNPKDKEGRYIEQVWKAIHYYGDQLTNTSAILIGDFNSNTIWDKQHKERSHTNVVKLLAAKDIHSCYHHYYKKEQGKELQPTLYMYRHQDKAYHIDYCFVSKDLLDKLQSVEVGEFELWNQYSDHVPVIVTL